MGGETSVARFSICASLLIIVTALVAQPRVFAQDGRQVRVKPPNPDEGYHGMAWDYVGPFSIGFLRGNEGELLQMSSYPTVSGVRYCSPAHRAGIKLGDEIVGVDGRDGKLAPLFGRGVNPPGTAHRLTLRRDGETIEVVITRIGRPEKTAESAGDRSPERCPAS